MKKALKTIAVFLILISTFTSTLSVYSAAPDTWAMTDGLGRVLSDNEDVGNLKNNKTVAMFYWPWHQEFSQENGAYNLTEILSLYPKAVNDYDHKAWSLFPSAYYFWDKPIYGYYSTNDIYVVRKQAELLADAGVDVIIMDCSNGSYLWEYAVDMIFRVFQQAKKDGVNVPQVSFLLNFSGGASGAGQITTLYNKIYKAGKYSDLWFYWDGKPLIMVDPNCIASNAEISKFFTFRRPEAGYNFDDTTVQDNRWSWLSIYPQARNGVDSKGNVEEMAVGVAQNWNHQGLVAMNDPDGNVRGRSYTSGNYSYSYNKNGQTVTINKNTANSVYYGLNFQQQWDYAIKNNPEIIFVTGWNEWVAVRQEKWQGTENAFGDQYSPEYSRDIEPSEGILKDYYYTQLAENIRRYKGVSALPVTSANKTIDINAETDQWANILPEYSHYANNKTGSRNNYGYGDLMYKTTDETKCRNDIVSSKVAYDDQYVYFMAETVKEITPYTDGRWMRLLIDTTPGSTTNSWEGFDYIINRNTEDRTASTTLLEKSTGGWNFTAVGEVEYSVSGKRIQIKIPRSYLGFDSASKPVFNFKWTDNNLADGDIMSLYTEGDNAPGSRFTFVFDPVTSNSAESFEIKLNNENSGLSISDGYLYGLSEKQSLSNILGYFENSHLLTSSKTNIGTGTVISLEVDGTVMDSVVAIIQGDVNGDGRITSTDYVLVKRSITNPDKLSEAGKKAGDMNNSGTITSVDYVRIKRYFISQ